MDYRELAEDDRRRFREIATYAFQPENHEPDFELDDPGANLGAQRALYEDGEPRAICQHYWFESRVRGDPTATPGLSVVATPPEHRRQGLVKRLLAESLAEYRDRGAAFSLLWPFEYAFYANFGWERANRRTRVECPPAALAVARGAESGNWRQVTGDEWAAFDSVYETARAGVDLALDRDEAWWRHRLFERWGTEHYAYLLERGDEPAGYLLYTVEEGDGRTLSVRDVAATDHAAWLGCLAFLSQHDSQVGTVSLPQPHGRDLYAVVDRPGDLTVTVQDGPMARVVDVETALSGLAVPDDAAATLAIEVTDPLVDWTEGVWAVTVDEGGATVTQTDAEPDATASIGALSELALGARPVEAVRRTSDLTVVDESVAETLGTLFPERPLALREHF